MSDLSELDSDDIKEMLIVGDYYLIKIISGERNYLGQIVTVCDSSVIVECWHAVKGKLCQTEIFYSDIDGLERVKPCHKCGAELVECWNLAPIGASADNKHRIYADGVYLCDACYDVWATKHDIQPLDGE